MCFRDCSGYECLSGPSLKAPSCPICVTPRARFLCRCLIAFHPCARRNVAVISRAEEVFTGIYSLGVGWDQPAGDREGLI